MVNILTLLAPLLLVASFGASLPNPVVDAPSSLVTRAGPSGSLNYPTGGTTILSVGGTGQIAVSYNQVQQPGVAETVGIDLTLEPFNGNQFPEVVIARGLSGNVSQPITGNFATLGDKCGYYRLVVTEHQIYNHYAISFRAAAPDIVISCVPLGR